jgi:hypothetical protein
VFLASDLPSGLILIEINLGIFAGNGCNRERFRLFIIATESSHLNQIMIGHAGNLESATGYVMQRQNQERFCKY